MEFIAAPLIIGLIAYFTYMTFELFARKKERLSLIEKMGQDLAPIDPSVLKSQFTSLLPTFSKKSFTSLRIGCLITGLGIGLLVGLFIVLYMRTSNLEYGHRGHELHSIALCSSVLIFGGLGLIISYLVEKKDLKKEE